MKMVILEVAGNYAAALSDDGTISRIPNQDYQVGQTLMSVQPKRPVRFTVYARRIAAVAAVFVLMLVAAGFAIGTPVTYVSLDVNPSVEYKLNMFDQVVEVVSVNDAAEELLQDATFAYQPAECAIKQTVHLLSESNYLKSEGKNNILVSATGSVTSKTKSVLNTITQATREATVSVDVSADIIAIESSLSDLKQAKELGTTPGKLLLVNQMVEADSNMYSRSEEFENMQDLLQKPVAELVLVISEDGLTQISQKNDSISYFQTDRISEASEADAISKEDTGMEQGTVSKDSSVVSGATVSVGGSSQTGSSNTSSYSSNSNTSSTESLDSSSDMMDPNEISDVVPGMGSSSAQDENTTSQPENSLDIETSDTTDLPSISEIPDVIPGFGAGDTSDTELDIDDENSMDITTSTPEIEDLPESSIPDDSEDRNSLTETFSQSDQIVS